MEPLEPFVRMEILGIMACKQIIILIILIILMWGLYLFQFQHVSTTPNLDPLGDWKTPRTVSASQAAGPYSSALQTRCRSHRSSCLDAPPRRHSPRRHSAICDSLILVNSHAHTYILYIYIFTDIYIYILYIYRDIYIYSSSSTSESENSLKLSAPKTQKPPSGARRGELGCQWGQAGQCTFETDEFFKKDGWIWWYDGWMVIPCDP